MRTPEYYKRRSKLICLALFIGILVCCIPVVMYVKHQNQHIVETIGVFDDKERLLNHDMVDGSYDFGEDVAFKFSRYGACEEVFEAEKRRVKQQLLDLDKILRYHISASVDPNDPTVIQHNAWVVEENLVKNQDDDDFRVYYFSTFQFCATYKANKDMYNNDIRDLYRAEKVQK